MCDTQEITSDPLKIGYREARTSKKPLWRAKGAFVRISYAYQLLTGSMQAAAPLSQIWPSAQTEAVCAGFMLEHMADAIAGLKLRTRAVSAIFSFMSVSFLRNYDHSTILSKSTRLRSFSFKNTRKNRFDMFCVILQIKF